MGPFVRDTSLYGTPHCCRSCCLEPDFLLHVRFRCLIMMRFDHPFSFVHASPNAPRLESSMKKVIKQKEKVWSQKPIQQGDRVYTKNMFAALKYQEEIHDNPTKTTSIDPGESENNEKNGLETEDNDEESNWKNSQNIGGNLKIIKRKEEEKDLKKL
ncbi:hypothetical protein HAX54_032571 [Datura stramonium]|uniref:Uncharacterized protein n=1 Tax=Datura stramonium TaxID=4076 RepID=A0ABS8VBG7_DATST|nr:hypothetical protein [Datura stramonium]